MFTSGCEYYKAVNQRCQGCQVLLKWIKIIDSEPVNVYTKFTIQWTGESDKNKWGVFNR